MSYSTKAAQAFTSILESEKDWEKRVTAMGKMEETLKTDFGLDLSVKDILLFRPALCAQISDNRTAVSKAGCDLATTLAETQSVGFAAHTQVFVNVLLKQTTVSVKVASDAAHVALCLMLRVQALPASKILLEIAKGLKDAHNSTLRRRCSLYLLILVKFRFAGLKSQLDDLPALVIALCRDASSTTRARARAVYMHLKSSSPKHASIILGEVDAKVKAVLSDPEVTLEEVDMDGFEPTPPASSANSRISSRSTSRSASRSHSRSGSPERQKSVGSGLGSGVNSPGGALDLSSLEKKLASLSGRGGASSPMPSISPSPSGSKQFKRETPTSSSATAKARASPSSTPTKTATPTSKTSAAKPTSTSTAKTATPAKSSTSKPTAATPKTSTASPAPVKPEDKDSALIESLDKLTSESGGAVPFTGNWRDALSDLRSLIARTKAILDMESNGIERSDSSSSLDTASQSIATSESIDEEVIVI